MSFFPVFLFVLNSPIGRKLIFLNTQKLVNEVSNDAAFRKGVVGSLNEVRYLSGDGLFTVRLMFGFGKTWIHPEI